MNRQLKYSQTKIKIKKQECIVKRNEDSVVCMFVTRA